MAAISASGQHGSISLSQTTLIRTFSEACKQDDAGEDANKTLLIEAVAVCSTENDSADPENEQAE